MKKVYKGKFDTPKKVIRDKKKQSAAYILLGFFAFVFIGSILGIIAFFRTNKKDDSAFNVVNASANVVSDFNMQGSINATDVFLKSPLTLPTHSITPLGSFEDVLYGYYLLVDNYNNNFTYDINGYYQGFFPFYNYLYQGIEDAQELLIGFTINLGLDYPEYSVNYAPTVALVYFDENNDIFDVFTFDVSEGGLGIGTSYTYIMNYTRMPTNLYSNAFFCIHYPAGYEYWFSTFKLLGVQVKELPYYYGNSYTYEQLLDIYNSEIEDAYHQGLQATDGYNQGYDEGYSSALDNINASLSGIFNGAQCDLYASNSNRVIDEDDIPTYEYNGYINLSYIFLEYAPSYEVFGNASYTFTFHNFEITPFNLNEYVFNFDVAANPGNTEPNWDMNVAPLIIRFYTNMNVYLGEFEAVDQFHFRIVVDLSTMRADEIIQEVTISGMAVRLYGGQYRVSNNDYRYMLGYEYGYDVAYEQFRSQYDYYMQLEYEKGLIAGRNEGYNEGYNQGAEASGNYTFTSLIGSVVDVPIRAFTSLFNFEILGVNLANFFFALFTMMLVLAVIKFLI